MKKWLLLATIVAVGVCVLNAMEKTGDPQVVFVKVPIEDMTAEERASYARQWEDAQRSFDQALNSGDLAVIGSATRQIALFNGAQRDYEEKARAVLASIRERQNRAQASRKKVGKYVTFAACAAAGAQSLRLASQTRRTIVKRDHHGHKITTSQTDWHRVKTAAYYAGLAAAIGLAWRYRDIISKYTIEPLGHYTHLDRLYNRAAPAEPPAGSPYVNQAINSMEDATKIIDSLKKERAELAQQRDTAKQKFEERAAAGADLQANLERAKTDSYNKIEDTMFQAGVRLRAVYTDLDSIVKNLREMRQRLQIGIDQKISSSTRRENRSQALVQAGHIATDADALQTTVDRLIADYTGQVERLTQAALKHGIALELSASQATPQAGASGEKHTN